MHASNQTQARSALAWDQKSYIFNNDYKTFFDFDSLNKDPTRIISSKSLNLYMNNIDVSLNGGQHPSESNIQIYMKAKLSQDFKQQMNKYK